MATPRKLRPSFASGSGVTRFYQAYYRSIGATFYPPGTIDVTNGVRIRW